mmetsp:Transcript_21880/g.64436  ORF Transcript_21880/g.64436 Transcript_21880/m.64436 type:complete len:301 (+) Transcript_21880:126-1028(+)
MSAAEPPSPPLPDPRLHVLRRQVLRGLERRVAGGLLLQELFEVELGAAGGKLAALLLRLVQPDRQLDLAVQLAEGVEVVRRHEGRVRGREGDGGAEREPAPARRLQQAAKDDDHPEAEDGGGEHHVGDALRVRVVDEAQLGWQRRQDRDEHRARGDTHEQERDGEQLGGDVGEVGHPHQPVRRVLAVRLYEVLARGPRRRPPDRVVVRQAHHERPDDRHRLAVGDDLLHKGARLPLERRQLRLRDVAAQVGVQLGHPQDRRDPLRPAEQRHILEEGAAAVDGLRRPLSAHPLQELEGQQP